jgi:type VII secretion protein EccE
MPRVWTRPQLPAEGHAAGRFGAIQLVAVELAVVAVSAALLAGVPLGVGLTGVAAAGLLAGVLGRSRGRWGYEMVAARSRLESRRRMIESLAEQPRTGPLRPLALLVPHLAITSATDRGTAIGVGRDELGWFAAMAVTPPTGPVGAPGAALRVDWLARLVAEATLPVSTVQLVTRQLAAPAGSLDDRTACARSYRELLGAASVPAHRESWLAVRLGPWDAADAAAVRGGDVGGVHKALAAVLSRIRTALEAAGLQHRVLDANELREALTVACGLERLGAGISGPVTAAPVPVSERWGGWYAAGVVHVCFAVRGWPPDPRPDLLTEVARLSGAATVNTAVLLRPLRDAPGGTENAAVGVRALVRVTAAPDRIAGCVQQVLANARRLGVRLSRLDGEHASGVYATAPTAAAGIAP